MNRAVFSTHQAARLCNVHHTTVISWVKEGKLKAYATPGGHRRIKEEELRDFMQKYELPMPEEMTRRGKKTVLVVDDDPVMLEELKESLRGKGFNLDFASSGFEAGRKIYRKKPDLILLDFKMPGMDGFEVCEILYRDKETVNIPVIAITVLTADEDVRKIKACGVKEYMSKPLNINKLLELIDKLLNIKTRH
jgi:excisionase family DNA binding protein